MSESTDTHMDPAPEQLLAAALADRDSFARCHVNAVARYVRLTRDLLILASKGLWFDLLERMGDDMNGCDAVDEETEALYEVAVAKAKKAQGFAASDALPGMDAPDLGYTHVLEAYNASHPDLWDYKPARAPEALP